MVAYVVSRFPKLTETFVLLEILAVERLGVRVELFPLLRERQPVMHPEAAPLVERAHYQPFLSWAIVRSQLAWLRRAPLRYLATWGAVLRGTWRSPNFLVGAAGIMPKVAHVARLMEAAGVNHVHCHFANHPTVAGYAVRRLTGIPYSFAAHGSDLHKDRRMLCQKLDGAAFAVTVSAFNRGVIERECPGGAGKVHVLHPGVDTDQFRPPPSRAGTPPLRIVCVGMLHEVKGQAHLVEACRLLRDRGVAVACRLVGDGPDRAALEAAIAAADLEGTVEIAGWCDRATVARLLEESDVLCAPSVPTREGKREGLPTVVLEGMSTGLPVVASRLSGIPEAVEEGHTGLLVEPGDGAGLAGALAALAADPALRERLGRAGRERVVARYDVHANAAELVRRFAGRATA